LLCPLSRAASDVRTLALVAAFIPNNPAPTEQRPPKMYATAVREPTAQASRTATMSRNGNRTTYSRRRNAIAPCSMRSARSCIGREPAGWPRT